MSDEAQPDRAQLEDTLGYHFEDRALLEAALTHSSFSHENEGEESNERLEFLGDAVIGLVVAAMLFEAHPDWSEGDLTRGLHQLVERRSLATAGVRLELGSHLRLGRTEIQSKGSGKDTIIGNAMEAVVGAVYLDGGLGAVEALAHRMFGEALLPEAPRAARDPKTRFQEWSMARYGEFPVYEVEGDTGRENDEERFQVAALVDGEVRASGRGRSKQRAEQAAAALALAQLVDADD